MERRLAAILAADMVGYSRLMGEDVYGDGVNLVARLEKLAEPGDILVSRTVHDHVEGKIDSGFEDLGEQQLKNISEPLRVFRVVTAAAGTTAAGTPRKRVNPIDGVHLAALPFETTNSDLAEALKREDLGDRIR